MRILVIGTGYVGLVTGACFAEMGHEVTCLDIDEKKIFNLRQGKIPIYEPGLEEIVIRNVEAGRLSFTTDYDAVLDANVIFIAVSTPASQTGECDLSYLKAAAISIADKINGDKIIVNKSTVPIGTTHEVFSLIQGVLKKNRQSFSIEIVSNPEFLKEGDAINDFMKPDRIVIGVESDEAKKVMKELYAPFNLSSDRILFMDICSAEMTKYASNAMLASRISFINEIAGLCEITGADVRMVRMGVGADKRIGKAFLYPGVGYGGSCFPKDLKALKALARKHDYDMPLLNAVEVVNEKQKDLMAKKMVAYFGNKGGLTGKKMGILGLAFKPGTDDMREAPSINIIRFLLQEGALLQLYDPIAMPNAKAIFKPSFNCVYAKNAYEALKNVDGVVLVTEWKPFRNLDLEKILQSMNGKAFFDGRNQYSSSEMKKIGFDYFCIGNGSAILVHES